MRQSLYTITMGRDSFTRLPSLRREGAVKLDKLCTVSSCRTRLDVTLAIDRPISPTVLQKPGKTFYSRKKLCTHYQYFIKE